MSTRGSVYAAVDESGTPPNRNITNRGGATLPLASGEIFAGYTILRLLGSGGMGEVYLAQHPRLPRRDALKILPADVSADGEYRERFKREADLAATLFHPHIVGIHDRGEVDEQLWISMDYIEGTDAAQLTRDRYPVGMPADEMLSIVTAVASALDYAHQRGLLHRDVKPANILLANPDDDVRRVFLSDFGIARQVGEVSGLTATNLTVATVPYAAPEQLMSIDLDGRADQYALAATAFHLLTGAPPYQDSNPVAVISQHLTATPPKLSSRRPELAHLDDVLSKALAKNPADRFDTCRQFAEALGGDREEPVSDQRTQTRLTTAAAPDTSASKGGRTRRRILIAAAVAAVIAAIVGVSGFVLLSKNSIAPGMQIPAGAVLNGVYRLDADFSKTMENGSPNPSPNKNSTAWFAYRSHCTTAGCVATVTQLDETNHQSVKTPRVNRVLHFINGHWQTTPHQEKNTSDKCIDVKGKGKVPGEYTEIVSSLYEPQLDGTFHGTTTFTILTNECGQQATVWSTPFVLSRTGDVPAGVAVPDPASESPTTTSNTTVAPTAGPVLDGAYRFDSDYTKATFNDAPNPSSNSDSKPTYQAFRSLCRATGCIATNATLDNNIQQVAIASLGLFRWVDEEWQNASGAMEIPCSDSNKTVTDTEVASYSLKPQPDGSLQGAFIIDIRTDECRQQGKPRGTLRIPITATRTGDTPPGVVLADPALF